MRNVIDICYIRIAYWQIYLILLNLSFIWIVPKILFDTYENHIESDGKSIPLSPFPQNVSSTRDYTEIEIQYYTMERKLCNLKFMKKEIFPEDLKNKIHAHICSQHFNEYTTNRCGGTRYLPFQTFSLRNQSKGMCEIWSG